MKAKRVTPQTPKKEAHESYIEMKVLEQQVEQVQKYLESLNTQANDLLTTIEAVDSFSKIQQGAHAFAPIANGIFFSCEIKDTEKLRLNVGNGIVVERTPAECLDMLKQHERELLSGQTEATAQLQALHQRMDMLQREAQPE